MPQASEVTNPGGTQIATIPQTQAGSPAGLAADIGGLLFINRGSGSNKQYCGGDLAGSLGAGYAYSLDITGYRSNTSHSARNLYATAVGHDNTASNSGATAIGYLNGVTGSQSVSVGYSNSVSGQNASLIGSSSSVVANYGVAAGYSALVDTGGTYANAIGYSAYVNAAQSQAIGYYATANIQQTTNLVGPLINRSDQGDLGIGLSAFQCYAGAAVVLMSQNVNFLALSTTTVSVPTGAVFYPDEVGVIVVTATSVTGYPAVSFGQTGNNTYYLASSLCPNLSGAYSRQKFTSLATQQGSAGTGLTATITTVGTGSTLTGRFYWKGVLMQQ